MTLGEKIQILRKQKGLSQEQLAEKITITRQAISRWELNESIPDVENILQLSKVFNVSTDYLLNKSALNSAPSEAAGDKEEAAPMKRRFSFKKLRQIALMSTILSLAIYPAIASFTGWWHPGWLIVAFPAVIYGGLVAVEEAGI